MKIFDSPKPFRRFVFVCAIGTFLLISSYLLGPVQGYYQSHGLTWLDSESKGYLRLLDGFAYSVNIRKDAADCDCLGHYSVSFPGQLTLFDEFNHEAHSGKITFWGILWQDKGTDRFMLRAFVGKSYERAVALPTSLFGKPLTEFWIRSLDRYTLDVVQPKGAPVVSIAMAKYAMEHSEFIDPSLPEVRRNALPLIATVRVLYGGIERKRFEIYSDGTNTLGYYSEGSRTSCPSVFRCHLPETSK